MYSLPFARALDETGVKINSVNVLTRHGNEMAMLKGMRKSEH